MATKEQTNANRKNAQSSTGPRTPQGKAIASKNATTHGLCASQIVITGEDPEQFNLHRNALLAEYAPQGPTESILVHRIATLSWRLERADRLQAATINTLVTEQYADPTCGSGELLTYMATAESPPTPSLTDAELILGTVINRDFEGPKVLDRLAIYEQRIENSLYKAIKQLQTLQLTRKSQPETPTTCNPPSPEKTTNKPNSTNPTQNEQTNPIQQPTQNEKTNPIQPNRCFPPTDMIKTPSKPQS